MPGGEVKRPRPPGQLVRDLITAIFDGRTDDVLALVHPGVVWRPVTRPGLSAYHGRAGTARMVADITAAYGHTQPEIVAISEDAPGQVRVEAIVVRVTGDGEVAAPPITSVFTLEDGLVKLMESNFTGAPSGGRDEGPAPGEPAGPAVAPRPDVGPGVAVVTMPAVAGYGSAGAIGTDIAAALATGPATLVIDFTHTRFCDSAGIREMVIAQRLAQAQGVDLRLAVPAALARIFALTGADRMLPSFPTLSAALPPRPAAGEHLPSA